MSNAKKRCVWACVYALAAMRFAYAHVFWHDVVDEDRKRWGFDCWRCCVGIECARFGLTVSLDDLMQEIDRTDSLTATGSEDSP